MSGPRNGRADRMRAVLANGPMTSHEIATALGDFSPQLPRALWQMKKQGYVALDGGSYSRTDKPQPIRYASTEERKAAKQAARVRWSARHAAARPPKPAREKPAPKAAERTPDKLPRIPRPKLLKPAQVVLKPRRKIEDAAFIPSGLTLAPVEKLALPDTSAWMAANPDKVLHLKHGEISRREGLSASDRASIRSVR